MQTPPHYRRTEALHDLFCRMCVAYEKGYCKRYDVPVEHDFTCDSWERNWDASEHQ